MLKSFERVDQPRAPWVPAPAKSSSANNVTATLQMNSSALIEKAHSRMPDPRRDSSSSSPSDISQAHDTYHKPPQQTETNMSSGNFRKDKIKTTSCKTQVKVHNNTHKQRQFTYQAHGRRPTSHAKKGKNGQRRTGMNYQLQSKDSLVDVTACLQEKRGEVLKLWEKNLLKNDPEFHPSIERVNRLALEAADEVEKLRRTIQSFQKQKDGLSEADCNHLEQMRINVLLKVKQFEEADNLLQELIAKTSLSKTSIVSAISKTSQTDLCPKLEKDAEKSESRISVVQTLPATFSQGMPGNDLASNSNVNVVILKENPVNFSEGSDSDSDTYEIENFKEENKTTIPMTNEDSRKIPALSGIQQLNHIKSLYEERVNFSTFQQKIGLNQALKGNSNENVTNKDLIRIVNETEQRVKYHPQQPVVQRVRFIENFEIKETQTTEEPEASSGTDRCEDLYREKIVYLQRHLMDTEHEVEELKAEVERIESNANLRVRILQNSVQDKFESLQAIPEFLEILDQRLSQTVQENLKLHHALQNKDMLIKEIYEQKKALEKQQAELQNELRKNDNARECLFLKNADLESNNMELRKEIETLTKQASEMTLEIESLKESHHKSAKKSITHEYHKENQKLKLHCDELRDQITQANRIIQTLRKSKTKLVASLNERIEELMDALQVAQQHKRVLGNQIRYLKKSYHEVLPAEIFKTMQLKKSFPASHHKKKASRKQKPVEEAKIKYKVAWQTGNEMKPNDLKKVEQPMI